MHTFSISPFLLALRGFIHALPICVENYLEVSELGERVDDDAEDDVEADGADEDEEGQMEADHEAELGECVL